ncbi:MAG: CusA/CzcA family heavy metal efflux RND transporter, partial [Bacteroidia bacterium]|nr:CusA/CzcA family heavy metal efflux RND transporter [Bacteroidia bacterium]
LNKNLKLPAGYFIEYGGTFQNLQEAKGRLMIAVPAALFLIFILLFLSFRSVRESLIIFSAIPLAAIGGVLAIYLRGMNFSISAGIGFIALFGVAVLNGIVLIAYFNRLEQEGETDVIQRILKGTAARLRPVLATAAVASLGFLPMALSTSAGSEVQKPLATVVIGGLISSTLLTLIVLPVLYSLFRKKKHMAVKGAALSLLLLLSFSGSNAQQVSLDSCIKVALQNHPLVQGTNYSVQQQQELKKTNFTLDPISLQYQGGQINSDKNDYNISAVTGIQNPFTIAKLTQLQNQKILLAQSQLSVTKNELVQKVSASYYQLMYGEQRLKLLMQLDSIYTDFANYAAKKYQVGESNLLEKISADAQLKQIRLRKQQAESDLTVFQTQLQQWTGITSPMEISDKESKMLSPPAQLDTGSLKQNPVFSFANQQVNVSIAEWKLEKSKWSPSFQFGAFNQSIDKVTPFWGWTIGTSIPIFKTGQSGRVNAANLQSKIAQAEFDNFKLNLNTAYTLALQKYRQNSAQLQYYNTEGLQLANTLTTVANKSYKAGDIGYVEFIQSTSQAYDIQNNYLETLNNYNQSVINLNYLISK